MFILFWVFHVAHVFGSLAFPFKFKHWMESKRFRRLVYIGEMTLILICGFIPPTIVIVFDNYQFASFPLCIPSTGPLFFYTYLLPITLLSTIGLFLLFSSFWILHKVSKYCSILCVPIYSTCVPMYSTCSSCNFS